MIGNQVVAMHVYDLHIYTFAKRWAMGNCVAHFSFFICLYKFFINHMTEKHTKQPSSPTPSTHRQNRSKGV